MCELAMIAETWAAAVGTVWEAAEFGSIVATQAARVARGRTEIISRERGWTYQFH